MGVRRGRPLAGEGALRRAALPGRLRPLVVAVLPHMGGSSCLLLLRDLSRSSVGLRRSWCRGLGVLLRRLRRRLLGLLPLHLGGLWAGRVRGVRSPGRAIIRPQDGGSPLCRLGGRTASERRMEGGFVAPRRFLQVGFFWMLRFDIFFDFVPDVPILSKNTIFTRGVCYIYCYLLCDQLSFLI